jgi:hypothetical protein
MVSTEAPGEGTFDEALGRRISQAVKDSATSAVAHALSLHSVVSSSPSSPQGLDQWR